MIKFVSVILLCAGSCIHVLSTAQTLTAGATVIANTPANGNVVSSESNSSTDGTRVTAVASRSDSTFLDFNPLVKGNASGSAFALAEYGVLKVSAASTGNGFAGGYANANASFADRFRIDGGSLNGTRGVINTKLEYQWFTGSSTDVSSPNNGLGVSLSLAGYFGNILATETFLSNFNNPYFESYIAVPNPDGTIQYLPQTFKIDVSSEFTFGAWLDFSAQLFGGTSATGSVDSDVAGNTVYQGSSVFVNAANSAYWGGLTVFTADGNEFSNYGLESLSGTDWRISKVPTVAAVPEPQTFALMMVGLLMISAVSRRKRYT